MKHEMNEYYAQRAEQYEKIYYRDDPARRKEINDEILMLKELTAGKDVLDIPVGTGFWTQYIAETASSIVATDLTPEMIYQAQQKKYTRHPSYAISDINKLPFANNSFDFIAVGFWISHHPLEQLSLLFAELKKLLKPNGKIWFIDNNHPAEQTHLSVGHDEHGNHFKKRFLDDGTEFTIIKNYFTEDDLKEIFAESFDPNAISINYGKYYWSVVIE